MQIKLESPTNWTDLRDEQGVVDMGKEDLLRFYEMNFHVVKEQIWRKGKKVEGKFYTVRTDTDEPVGIVGKEYSIIQNRTAVDLLYQAVDRSNITVERCMVLKGGRRIIMIARRPEEYLVAGENIDQYLIFSNGHTGADPFVMVSVPTRRPCLNTLRVKPDFENGVYRIRHVRNAPQRVEEVMAGLDKANRHIAELKAVGESLASVKISDREFDQYLARVVRVPEKEYDEHGRVKNQRAINNARNRQLDIAEIYYAEENLNNIRGTAWGAWQAVVQYNDWNRDYRSPERRIEKLIDGETMSQRALDILRD